METQTWWVVYRLNLRTKTKTIVSVFGGALETKARERLAECRRLAKTDFTTLSAGHLNAETYYGGHKFGMRQVSGERPTINAQLVTEATI